METTETHRKNWKIGSLLQVFVASRNKWYSATITSTYRDADGEWLIISIQNKILFELNRFDANLRRHKTKQEIEQEMKTKQRIQAENEEKQEIQRLEKEKKKLQLLLQRKSQYDKLIAHDIENKSNVHEVDNDSYSSDGDLSTDYYTESDESSSSISVSSSDSLNSMNSEVDEANNKYSNDKNQDPALIVIVIERAGTVCINGKYLYKGQQRGKPLWQKDNDSKGKLWWKYDNLWTLEYDNNDLYLSYTLRELPPSSGWEIVDNAQYPSPSVILHRLDQIETIKNYVTGAGTTTNADDNEMDDSFSPLNMTEYDFEIVDDFATLTIAQQFGFSLELNEITQLCYVNNVILDSQASDMGLQIGDILSNAEETDISLLGNVDKMYKYLKDEMEKLIQANNSFIIINFGRKKNNFPIVLVSRSGTNILDGKYSIQGRENGAWKFVQNQDPKYQISRIYYDSDEDEAVWVVRTETENAIQAQKEEEQRLLLQKQNEEENKRRTEEEERIKRQQLEQERKKKIVDERWLYPLIKDAQLSAINGSANSSKCKKQIFFQYFQTKKINIQIIEIIWNSIDKKKKGVITTRQYFAFKTNFTMVKMRKLLPEFCPPPENVLKSQQAAARRKKQAEEKREKSQVKINQNVPGKFPEPKSVQELRTFGFKHLKELCVQNNLPPNGTKVQLFIKLKEKLFAEEKKEELVNIVISTANDQIKKKQFKKLPLSPAMGLSPVSVEIRDDIDNKEEVLFDAYSDSNSMSSDGEYSESNDGGNTGKFTDYYCGMTGCKDMVPPNYGWEAVEPNGIWPAPGMNVYDIELSKQNLQAPTIERVVASPGCATIYFVCNEPRIPKVCQHMEYWFEIEAIGNEQVIKCSKSPAVFTNLINGNNYQFVVKCCSILSIKYSEKSEIVTPLLLPNKPYFTNIESKPKELFLYWKCKNYGNKDVNATVTLITTPIVPIPKGYRANDNGAIILNSNTNTSDKNVIHLTGLDTGTPYEIQLRSSNAVGAMESQIEIASPVYPPPQPTIKKVIAGNREIIIDVQCDGWHQKERKCWFEVDVNPSEPTLEFLQNEIYKKRKKKKDRKKKILSPRIGVIPAHLRKKSMATMKRLQSARSRGTFSTVLYKIDLSAITAIDEDTKTDNVPFAFGAQENDEDEIPAYKRKKRYHSLPIIISPLVNGEEYVVRVQARNYTEIKCTEPSPFVTPLGVPPKPSISSVYSRDGEVKILFECDDYSSLEYRAVYEVISQPKTTKTKTRRFNMKFRNLDNGNAYSFRVRGVNSIGKGEWSENSQPIKPLSLPLNIQELRMVPGNQEISLYWVSDDVNKKKYDGWFEITSKPITYTIITKRQQCTFKNLVNDQEYKFKIYGMNVIGRSNKHETHSIKPKANVKIALYKRLKRKTALNIHELRANFYKQIAEKDKKTKQELGGDKRKKGKIIDAQQQFQEKKEKKKFKKKKKKKKDKNKKKKGGFDLSGFASMVEKQQNKERENDESIKNKNEMNRARNALFARKRHTSIMDVSRVDNFLFIE